MNSSGRPESSSIRGLHSSTFSTLPTLTVQRLQDRTTRSPNGTTRPQPATFDSDSAAGVFAVGSPRVSTFRSIMSSPTEGVTMPRMLFLASLVLLFLVPLVIAKDKNKSLLSADVLRAQTVMVVIDSGAGEPVTDPGANRRAREDVENALTKWGRFRLVMESQSADLVIAVRTGTPHPGTPTIRGGSIDNRPVILQPNDNGGIRVGGQRGRQPDPTNPGLGAPQDTGPRIGTDMGSPEDAMEVYRGGVQILWTVPRYGDT